MTEQHKYKESEHSLEKHKIFFGDEAYMNIIHDKHNYQSSISLNYCPFCGLQLKKNENT